MVLYNVPFGVSGTGEGGGAIINQDLLASHKRRSGTRLHAGLRGMRGDVKISGKKERHS